VNDAAPPVSVLTPSSNHAAYLEETIQSVLCQDYTHLEHIIIDGASSDATLNVLQRYDTNLRLLSEPGPGQADAVNKGLRLARGDILGWLNADDTYLLGAIHNDSATSVRFGFANCHLSGENGKHMCSIRCGKPISCSLLSRSCFFGSVGVS
jgi:glycosyltransferase involved in cell wall biosynthesis